MRGYLDIGYIGEYPERGGPLCPHCGAMLGADETTYIVGKPGRESHTAKCRICGCEVRFTTDLEYRDNETDEPLELSWVSEMGHDALWVADDSQIGFYAECFELDIVGYVEAINVDGSLPCFILEDGSIHYRYDVSYQDYTEYITNECDPGVREKVDATLREIYRRRMGYDAPKRSPETRVRASEFVEVA